jgi:lipoprotein-anchoring transpeptidase ErfK/SrfK
LQKFNRRALLIGAPLALAGCAQQRGPAVAVRPAVDPYYADVYGEIDNEPYPVEALDIAQMKPQFMRREVSYSTNERPGTIVVDPAARYLYLIGHNGRALRYGVGVGKSEAFNFRGAATIGRKEKWPRWTPTPAMIAREPQRYGPYRGGMSGGPENPLGARALYLYRGNVDTHYRLHGTNEPWSIGTKVSSGCVRLVNQDIIDLFDRVPLGTKVVVLPSGGGAPDDYDDGPEMARGPQMIEGWGPDDE